MTEGMKQIVVKTEPDIADELQHENVQQLRISSSPSVLNPSTVLTDIVDIDIDTGKITVEFEGEQGLMPVWLTQAMQTGEGFVVEIVRHDDTIPGAKLTGVDD